MTVNGNVQFNFDKLTYAQMEKGMSGKSADAIDVLAKCVVTWDYVDDDGKLLDPTQPASFGEIPAVVFDALQDKFVAEFQEAVNGFDAQGVHVDITGMKTKEYIQVLEGNLEERIAILSKRIKAWDLHSTTGKDLDPGKPESYKKLPGYQLIALTHVFRNEVKKRASNVGE